METVDNTNAKDPVALLVKRAGQDHLLSRIGKGTATEKGLGVQRKKGPKDPGLNQEKAEKDHGPGSTENVIIITQEDHGQRIDVSDPGLEIMIAGAQDQKNVAVTAIDN